MSAFGTKRTSRVALHMSAFGGKADIHNRSHADLSKKFDAAGIVDVVIGGSAGR